MTNFISKRGQVSNFLVMDLFEQARKLEQRGKQIVHFEAGQPTAKLPNRVFKIDYDSRIYRLFSAF